MISTTFPVLLPDMPELRLPRVDFDSYITKLLHPQSSSLPIRPQASDIATDALLSNTDRDEARTTNASTAIAVPEDDAPFMGALLDDESALPSFDDRDGKMLTENADVAYSKSGSALVDAFFEIEDVISGTRLRNVLDEAWKADPEATLKIIWNARSIHLGKSSRSIFYRAVGWLAENHPVTLLVSLRWLVHPLIQKKAPKPVENRESNSEEAVMLDQTDADSDFELVDESDIVEGQPSPKKIKLDDDAAYYDFDVRYGGSHGYWKDLLNILVLAANDELRVDGKVRAVLNVEHGAKMKYERDWTKGHKKTKIADRHDRTLKMLEIDLFYKALHLTVARLFADQLKADAARLESGQKSELKRITLAAKWAPSHKGQHDKHSFIVSSIAELLYPFDTVAPDTVDPADRVLYLKHARQAYQLRTLSPLRKALDIVERPITAEQFDEIKYNRVPSLAMQRYATLFAKKDFDRFDSYIDKVASGKATISGATLLPSTLVKTVCEDSDPPSSAKGANAAVEDKIRQLRTKTIDGQWNTLCQRVRDSGNLKSAIAVCDVSGSMSRPVFPDKTCPMDSAIGLSLLLAEITDPPFGGAFITFSQTPEVVRVGGPNDKRTLQEKVEYIKGCQWGMNTNLVAVFEDLILPMAKTNSVKPEDMVKTVFVFSDMQFDSANGRSNRWSTSYQRILDSFAKAGYEMPKLIFWNLAGGRGDTAPKPVTADEEGTSLVSGYSQGQMKMFLENGQFDDIGDEEVVEVQEVGDEVVIEKSVKKARHDPLGTVKKAISHEAYRMLKVAD